MKKISREEISNELILFVRTDILDSTITITAETPFSQVGLDSMSVIQLVLFIERKFAVVLSEKDLTPENLRSIHSLAECTFKYL
ncbi:MAG: acyl carrier protein [Bacteroidota bacterium]